MGETVAKTRFYFVGILGLFWALITVAEPDMQILTSQINEAAGGALSGFFILRLAIG